MLPFAWRQFITNSSIHNKTARCLLFTFRVVSITLLPSYFSYYRFSFKALLSIQIPYYLCFFYVFLKPMRAGIAQFVQRLATDWTVRGPNPVGRRDFPHPFRPALGSTQPPIQSAPGLSRWGKRASRGVDHPPPSSAEVIERVELYLYSTSVPSWPVLRWTVPFI
jgi:hypothetical protein